MSVKKNIVANFLGQGITGVLNLAFIPVYIQYLGIEAYGLIGLFAILQVWLALLDMGMSPTLGREMARFSAGAVSVAHIRDLLYTLTLLCLGVALTIAAGMALAAPFLASSWLDARVLSPDDVRNALLIMAVVIGLRFVEGVQRSALIGLQHQVWLNVLAVIMAVLRNGGAVAILALVSPTIQAYLGWQGAMSLLALAAVVVKLWRVLPQSAEPRRFSVKALREVRAFAGGMFGISLLAILLTQVDKLLLSKLLPLDQFGYYMLAANVTAVVYMVVAPVTQAVYPSFVRLAETRDTQALARRYHHSSQLVAVLLAPIAMIFMAFPHTLIFVWSGDAELARRTAPLLALLTIGCFTNALMYIPHQLQLAHGWTSLSLRFNLVAVMVLIPAVLIAVPVYGPAAAAMIFAILNVAYMTGQMPLMHRRLLAGELRRWYAADIGLPVAGAMLVTLSVRYLVGDAAADRLAGAAVLGVTGLAASAAAGCGSDAVRRVARGVLAALPGRA